MKMFLKDQRLGYFTNSEVAQLLEPTETFSWPVDKHMFWIEGSSLSAALCERHHIFVTFVTLVCWQSEEVTQATEPGV